MKIKNTFRVIGLMSGTSLDGLDIAYCWFSKKGKGWGYKIEKSQTLKYTPAWKSKLSAAHTLQGEELIALDADFGRFLGKTVADFISRYHIEPDFIASHGHTVYHQPAKGFTYQIGNGNAIHAVSGVPVVYDFRSLDVMRGGEGAPLVPAGDKFLFHDYDVCLNLGGIANISMDMKGKRTAFDVCFCNMGSNYLALKTGKEIDMDGAMAARGEISKAMLQKLKGIYLRMRKKRPSLGREIFEQRIKPLLDDESISIHDRLRTVTESSALEIASAIIENKKNPVVLCTGGGAFNSFLVSRMLEHCGDRATLIIPEAEVVKFKEALVFAFLGVLRVSGEINCLKSVTHAVENSSSGVMVAFRN